MKRYPKYGTKEYTTSAGNPHLREGGWTYYPDKVKGRDYEGMPVTFWLRDAFDNVGIYENADDEYGVFTLDWQHRPFGNAKTGDVLLYWRKESKPYIYPSMSAAIDAAIRAYPHEFNIHDSGKLFKSPPSRKKKARKRRNPRKISLEAAEALEDHRPFKRDNTEVRQLGRDKSRLYLHGSAIAEMRGDEVYVTTAGYSTATTKERLNALPDVRVHTSKGQLYLNGKKWSGKWTRVDPVGTWYELKSNTRRRKNSSMWPKKIGKLERINRKSKKRITYVTRGANLTIEHVPNPRGGGPNIGGYWVEMRVEVPHAKYSHLRSTMVVAQDLRKTEKGALALAERYVKKYARTPGYK